MLSNSSRLLLQDLLSRVEEGEILCQAELEWALSLAEQDQSILARVNKALLRDVTTS